MTKLKTSTTQNVHDPETGPWGRRTLWDEILSTGKDTAGRKSSPVVRTHLLPEWEQPRCAWTEVRSCWGFGQIHFLPVHFHLCLLLFFLPTAFIHERKKCLGVSRNTGPPKYLQQRLCQCWQGQRHSGSCWQRWGSHSVVSQSPQDCLRPTYKWARICRNGFICSTGQAGFLNWAKHCKIILRTEMNYGTNWGNIWVNISDSHYSLYRCGMGEEWIQHLFAYAVCFLRILNVLCLPFFLTFLG